MKQTKVVLSAGQQIIVGDAFLETFKLLKTPVLAIAIHATHVHLQGQFDPKQVRIDCGKVKKNAWYRLCEHGWQGKLWAKRGKYQHIQDYQHQKNTHTYIVKHSQENAWVWKWNKKGGSVIHVPK